MELTGIQNNTQQTTTPNQQPINQVAQEQEILKQVEKKQNQATAGRRPVDSPPPLDKPYPAPQDRVSLSSQPGHSPEAAERARAAYNRPKPEAAKRPNTEAEEPKEVPPENTQQADKSGSEASVIERPEPVSTAIRQKVEDLFSIYPNGGVKPQEPGPQIPGARGEGEQQPVSVDLQA